MILLVLIASILIVAVTIYQYDEETKEYNIERFGRKEAATKVRISQLLKKANLETVTAANLSKLFQQQIFDISKVHTLDISIFDLDGNLLKTSIINPFKDTIKKQISSEILKELEAKNPHRIFNNTEVKNGSNETSYSYITDLKLKRIGVLQLKFFQDNSEQKRELKEFMYRLAYVYLLMFLVAIALAYFLSSYITRSIKTISDRIHTTRLHKRNEKIALGKVSSEINTLVTAYNSMIDELQESAVKLAKSEREQAWREMAKQVAHEIKNPLTPMRLTVQSFEQKFNPEDPTIKEKVKEYSQTLIQQIDVMNSIASAFSDFAKMPIRKKEEIDAVSVVKSALDIFNEAYINYTSAEKVLLINLDKTQLIRIITNLVTNAIQATENEENPKIEVHVSSEKSVLKITVTDNGKGIQEDVAVLIFEPKFTTKTSGMGLGLPMIKQIIETYDGTISFTSEEGKGTVFTVTLPKT
ncbi:MAG: HAMP domain-containing sensor histidine kinase [Polaribacter sp.]|nr:HAMP domain-containing sensor histidine kinase [Polaribacter sp.]